MLRIASDTRSPQALGSWVSLAWLDVENSKEARGPLGDGPPTEAAARQSMLVADLIAEGRPPPPSGWWVAHDIGAADRISTDGWAARVGSVYTRRYAHGVAVALGWLLGKTSDSTLMTPVFDGAGGRIAARYREECQALLWLISERARSASAG